MTLYFCLTPDSEGSGTASRRLWCPRRRRQLIGCWTQNSRAWTHCTAQDSRQAVRSL